LRDDYISEFTTSTPGSSYTPSPWRSNADKIAYPDHHKELEGTFIEVDALASVDGDDPN
jgi:hypothetical protein